MNADNEIIIREKLKVGLSHFNNGKFFEAHEVLESAWKLDHSKRKFLIQGLVQFSVGCYHARRKNWAGAERVLLRARSKLVPFQGSSSFVDLTLTLSQLNDLIERILRIKNLPNEHIEFIVDPKIYYIEE
jgi:hypothetical protein